MMLYQKTGLSDATISRMYRGKSLQIDNLKLIGDCLGVSTDFIIFGKDKSDDSQSMFDRKYYLEAFSKLSDEDLGRMYEIGVIANIIG